MLVILPEIMVDRVKLRVIGIILVLFSTGIGTWFTILLLLEDWNSFTPQLETPTDIMEIIENTLFFFTSGIFFAISIKLALKYHQNKKDAALLLSLYNLLYGASILVESIGNISIFTLQIDDGFQSLTYCLFAFATTFFYLFLQDLFADSFLAKKHQKSHAIYFPITIFALVTIMIASFCDEFSTMSVVMIGMFLVICVILAIWASNRVFMLRKKSTEKPVRSGLLKIGIANIFFIVLIIAFVLKAAEVSDALDILVPISAVCLTVFTYTGFIQPSRK